MNSREEPRRARVKNGMDLSQDVERGEYTVNVTPKCIDDVMV